MTSSEINSLLPHAKVSAADDTSIYKSSSRRSLALAYLGGCATVILALLALRRHSPPEDAGLPSSSSIPPLDSTKSCPNYSPVYPSEGGPDCPVKCSPGRRSASSVFHYLRQIANDDDDDDGDAALAAANTAALLSSLGRVLSEAGGVIQSYDPNATVYNESELHVSFGYYCCQTDNELSLIKSVLDRIDWASAPLDATFAYVTCAVDGPRDDHVSLILMFDQESNERWMERVERVEDMIEEEAAAREDDDAFRQPILQLRRPRQEPFHSTLASINGTTYPVAEVVKVLNERFASKGNGWTNLPISISRPYEGVDF